MNSFLDMDDNFDEFNRNFNRSSRRRIRRKSRRRKRKPLYRRDKITMYDYLASSVPADASFVINKYGRFEKPRNERELAKQLKSFVKMYGEKAPSENEVQAEIDLLRAENKSLKEKIQLQQETIDAQKLALNLARKAFDKLEE